MVRRWMKVLVLVAGFLGVLGFVEPFFEIGDVEVSAYRIASRADSLVVRLTREPIYADEARFEVGGITVEPRATRSMIPYYFASAIVFLLVGFIALVRGRLSGFVALPSLCAALFALGGWMREYRFDRDLVRDGHPALLAVGAKLLLLSGLLGLIGSVVVLVKREAEVPKPPPPPPEIPEARVVT
ncbi:MAG TPA: hypothetical protein VFV99_22440 [Kofleriaceae bacterium]|nr:hypothetical protein [Kofleriaceae bacterium]